MKKFTFLLLALICSVTSWAAEKAVDRTAWKVTACNETPAGWEGTGSGTTAAIFDADVTTYYHSDWSGSCNTAGDSGLQAFLVDMAKDYTDLTGFDYMARTNSNSGHVYTCRVYVYADGALPTDIADLASLTSDNKETVLASTNTNLGTPAFNNSDDAWSYSSNSDVKTGSFSSKLTGRYILFIQDTGYDKWMTCGDFNVYQEVASISYTVSGGSVVYDGTTYADGATITLDSNIDTSKLSAATVAGKTGSATVNGTTITVSYYNTFVAPTVAEGLAPQVSSTVATSIESGKFYVVKGYNQANAAAVAYLYNADGSIKGNTGTPTIDDNYVWYVQNATGDNYYMYNMGAQKFLTMGTGNGSAVKFTDSDAFVQFTAGDGVFAIKEPSSDTWIDFGWAGTSPTTWGGGCAGSRRAEIYEVEYVDEVIPAKAILLTAIAAAKDEIGTNPGWKSADDVDPLVTAGQAVYDNASATLAEVEDATTALNDIAYIMPDRDNLYQVISALPGFETQQGVKKAMYANGTKMSWKTLDDNDASMFWNFTLDEEEGNYQMYNDFTSLYPGVQTTRSGVYPTSEDAVAITLTPLGHGQFNLKTEGSGFALHTGGHSSGAGVSGDIVAWDGSSNTGSAWYIVETTADEAAAAKATIKALQGHTTFNVADDEVLVKADEIGSIDDINAAINAVNAINVNTASVAEMGACYAANAATINSLTAYGTLADITYTLKPGFGTMCLPCWGKGSDDTFQVYTCAGLEEGSETTLALTESSNMAPKTPFIVENKTDNDIKFHFIGWNKVTDATTTFTAGLLTGTIADMAAPADSYVLQNQDDVVGFYQVGATVPTVNAYHCYLTTDSDVKAFYFDQADAIQAVEALTNGSAKIYDLNGRQLQKLQKGINIVNGHKIMVK